MMKQFVVMLVRRIVPGLLALLVACWSAASARAAPLSPPCTVEVLLSCTFQELAPQKVIRPWKHRRSGWVARSGAPHHSVQDLLVTEGSPITIEGKFTYGDHSKDLEDEAVVGFLNTAEGWISLGEESTSEDGRVWFLVATPLRIGVYDVRLSVGGDGSVAEARLWILPRGTHLAIFDIDGTLTTSDEEIFRNVKADLFFPLLHRRYVPKAYTGAALLTMAQAARGSVNVYLTGRPYWLANTTRKWLQGPPSFAPGVLHVTDSNKEAIPRQEGVGTFKLNFLKKLVDAGFLLDVAYGNAKTDIDAYLGARLAPEAVWIIGRYGGVKGTHAVNGSWEDRVREVKLLPSISQPWQERRK
jgi:phosphatidate phosphatase PAH1